MAQFWPGGDRDKSVSPAAMAPFYICSPVFNLVQISWRLVSLLQNHSRKSVGHCVRVSASMCLQK